MKKYIKKIIKEQLRRWGYTKVGKNILPSDFFGLLITSAIENNKQNFNFVQIGANDGVSNDPIHEIITRERVPGLLVEPLPDIYEKLKNNYSKYEDKNRKLWKYAQVAITESDKPVKIYRVAKEVEKDYKKYYKESANASGVSSLSKLHVESFIKKNVPELLNLWHIEECIDEIEVKGFTFRSLCDHYGIERIGLLQIDTEGHDWVILKQVLDAGFMPKIINFEYKNLATEEILLAKEALLNYGYSVFKHKGNLCAFKKIELL